ncbi:porin [Pseudoduganella sp. RAF53_2]|uniref:porin n=1 Tax=unclassified Pseudoduganella TaxID=2637179 RepID=UPI003F99E1AE
MKKTLISLAVLAAATTGVAHAQSAVQIYGIVDAGVVYEQGGKNGNVTKVTSGAASASRIGFKGTEDLGGGLNAIFVLEGGFRTDTGEQDVAGSIFQRQAFVGLSSKDAGTITLGRQYTPWYNALAQVGDPFQAGLAGSAKNLFPASGNNQRFSNSVLYHTPEFMGLSGDVAYGFGEQNKASAGRQISASINYSNGPLNARLAYMNHNNDTAVGATVTDRDIGHNTLLAVNYDFQIAKAYFMFGQNKGLNSTPLPNATAYTTAAVDPSTDNRNYLVGASVPVGTAGTVLASYSKVDDRGSFSHDADQWAIGYTHALSKRTSTYLAFAKIKNKNGASYTVGNNTEAGSGDKAFNIGMKHSF